MTEKSHKTAAAYSRQLLRQRESYARLREIGPIPPVGDARLRSLVEMRLTQFLSACTCMPEAWVQKNCAATDELQHHASNGMSKASALRGLTSVKFSALDVRVSAMAALWCLLTGRCRVVAVVRRTVADSNSTAAAVREELETNDSLLALFPEVAHPVRSLAGRQQRAPLLNGAPMEMELFRRAKKARVIKLPRVPGSKSSGGTLIGLPLRKIERSHFEEPPGLFIVEGCDDSDRRPVECAARFGAAVVRLMDCQDMGQGAAENKAG